MSGVVMLAAPGRSTRIIFHALNQAFGVERVILESPVPRRQLLQSRVKRWGARKVVGQVLFRALMVPPLRTVSERRIRAILDQSSLSDAPIPEETIVRVTSVNSEECRSHLRALSPRVVVINGTRIIKADVLSSIDARFINIHVGITPTYRGVHGGYWALVEHAPDACGVTVYFVDPGIDTGAVIAQALIHPTPEDNFGTYPFLQVAAGVPLAIEAVRNVLAGHAETVQPPERPSKLWTHPTLAEYLVNRVRLGVK